MNTTRTYSMTNRAEGVAGTRDRITGAALDLLLELPYEDVTLAGIARAAGVSHQTVLNHFESKEGVAIASARVLSEQTVAARNAGAAGDTKSAVHALVGEYERWGDANFRWAATSERLGQLASMLEEGRASHRAWLVDQFGAQLPTAAAARERTLAAVYAATDVYTWKLLRRDLHLSRTETERVIGDMVSSVLAHKTTSSQTTSSQTKSRRRAGKSR